MPLSPDLLLEGLMDSLIRLRRLKGRAGTPTEEWGPGRKLKLLLAGYNGTRNTGADVRVEEMIRQLRKILGDEHAELTVFTMDPRRTDGYFAGAIQRELPEIFPLFLSRECPRHHGVVACEGSMFKSKFANALSTMMAGALGLANAERKLSVGYGAEVGDMTWDLKAFVASHCRESLVICRNEHSRKLLDEISIRNTMGTDTAWTFPSSPPEKGRAMLERLGWDGRTPVLAVSPINPFWWPVKPSLLKAAARMASPNAYADTHYKSIYFHEYGEAQKGRYRAYLRAIAAAVRRFRAEEKVFPLFVAMEALDHRACEDLSLEFGETVPILSSRDVNMYDLVGALRLSSYLISSRFHAVVTSMPAQVAPLGITMDERIRNVLTDAGLSRWILRVDEEGLEEKIYQGMLDLRRDRDAVRAKIGAFIPKQLELMGRMGMDFLDEVQRVYPEFPRKIRSKDWHDYLPSYPAEVGAILERHG